MYQNNATELELSSRFGPQCSPAKSTPKAEVLPPTPILEEEEHHHARPPMTPEVRMEDLEEDLAPTDEDTPSTPGVDIYGWDDDEEFEPGHNWEINKYISQYK